MILPEYIETYFLPSPPENGWPENFHIITAYNPRNDILDEEANKLLDLALREHLSLLEKTYFRVTGCSLDQSHYEHGWGVEGLSAAESIELGKLFGQHAIFEIKEGTLSVVDCDSGARVLAGTFAEQVLTP